MENGNEGKEIYQTQEETTGKKVKLDEGVLKGEMIMTWSVALFFVSLIALGILGLIVIVSGWVEGLIITIVGGFSAFTAYLFMSALGMFIKKISLIEQHLKKISKNKNE